MGHPQGRRKPEGATTLPHLPRPAGGHQARWPDPSEVSVPPSIKETRRGGGGRGPVIWGRTAEG